MTLGEHPIRVLVVEDSLITRRVIVNAITKSAGLRVVGTAENGKEAIIALEQYAPDLITLDIEMPEMDGLAALKVIRKMNPSVPIIMLSSLTRRGSASTIEALTLGASDYVAKPEGMANPEEAYAYLEAHLIPKIRDLSVKTRHQRSHKTDVPHTPPFHKLADTHGVRAGPSKVDAVGIAISTGGPAALAKLFEQWREPLSVPLFIVQHMPPKFTALLASRLSSLGATVVEEPYDGQSPKAGHAYIAPGGWHMQVLKIENRTEIRLSDAPPENHCRPSADILFRSLATAYGARTLAIVMTGMGNDGTNGARTLHAAGAYIAVQDQASSTVWGMPGSVISAKLAHATWALDDIAPTLSRLAP